MRAECLYLRQINSTYRFWGSCNGAANDVVASGELLLCVTFTNEEKETISRAASELVRRENLDAALVMLEEIGLLWRQLLRAWR